MAKHARAAGIEPLIEMTVLICTHNGARTISEAVVAAGNQVGIKPESVEILVVDNRSTDETVDIVRSLQNSCALPIRLLKEEKPGKAYALTAGIKEARGALITVVDDDNLLSTHFLLYTLQMFKEFPQLGMIGSVNNLDVETEPEWFCLTRGRYACASPHLDGEVRRVDDFRTIASAGLVAGAGSTFRRAPIAMALERGFEFLDRDLSPRSSEDSELCYAFQHLGWWFGADKRITLRHKVHPDRLTWEHARRLWRLGGATSPAFDAQLSTADGTVFTRRGTWWWMLGRRVRRILLALPTLARLKVQGTTYDRAWLDLENEIGGIVRLARERGSFTARARRSALAPWRREPALRPQTADRRGAGSPP